MKQQKIDIQKFDIIILFVFVLIMMIVSYQQDQSFADKQEEASFANIQN